MLYNLWKIILVGLVQLNEKKGKRTWHDKKAKCIIQHEANLIMNVVLYAVTNPLRFQNAKNVTKTSHASIFAEKKRKKDQTL